MYRQNSTKFVSKIIRALHEAAGYDPVDASRLAVIGYGLGGLGALHLVFAGHDGLRGARLPAGLRGVAALHGGIQPRMAIRDATTRPALLLELGTGAETQKAVEALVRELQSVKAVYEIVRQGSGVGYAVRLCVRLACCTRTSGAVCTEAGNATVASTHLPTLTRLPCSRSHS